MEIAILSFLTFLLIALLWALICNKRTFDQRTKIYLPKYDDENFYEKLAIFDSVSYDKHFWFLITFRNPSKLYNAKK